MSRSGYSDDLDNGALNLWRGAVDRAIHGKRGQAFFRDLVAALDAMPDKRLTTDELQGGGEVCALGSLMQFKGLDPNKYDPEDHEGIGAQLNIARCLVMETEFENDQDFRWRDESPEQRWRRMRSWAESNLRKPAPQATGGEG